MTKPQLLLLPGLLNDADLWRDQIAGLSDIADCVVPDLTQLDTLSALARSVLAWLCSIPPSASTRPSAPCSAGRSTRPPPPTAIFSA